MIRLDMQSRIPISQQLINGILQLISLGVLETDEQMPSVRNLARDLGINPNTVQKAYQDLESKGVLYSVSGKGNFVRGGQETQAKIKETFRPRLQTVLHDAKQVGYTIDEIMTTAKDVFEEGISK